MPSSPGYMGAYATYAKIINDPIFIQNNSSNIFKTKDTTVSEDFNYYNPELYRIMTTNIFNQQVPDMDAKTVTINGQTLDITTKSAAARWLSVFKRKISAAKCV